MKLLKAISIISYLLINGLGEHGMPNFVSIPYCLFVFIIETVQTPFREISWGLGLIWILTSLSIIGILYSRTFIDRYWLIIYFISLSAVEVFFSGILHTQRIVQEFIVPLMIFLISTTFLIIRSFRSKEEITTTDINQ